jgi:hypothetical protein
MTPLIFCAAAERAVSAVLPRLFYILFSSATLHNTCWRERERERKRKETKIFNDAEKIHPSITKNERKKRG